MSFSLKSQKVVDAPSTLLWAAEYFLSSTNTNLFEVNFSSEFNFKDKCLESFENRMLRHWMYAYGETAGLKQAKTIIKPNFSKKKVSLTLPLKSSLLL